MENIRKKDLVDLGPNGDKILRRLNDTLIELRKRKGYEKLTFLISDGARDFLSQFQLMLKKRQDIFRANPKDTKVWATKDLKYMQDKNIKDVSNKSIHKESMVRLYGIETDLVNILYKYEILLSQNPTQNTDYLALELYKSIAQSKYGRFYYDFLNKTSYTPNPKSLILKQAFKHCDYNAFDLSYNDLVSQIQSKIILVEDNNIEKLKEHILKAMDKYYLLGNFHGAGSNKHFHISLR